MFSVAHSNWSRVVSVKNIEYRGLFEVSWNIGFFLVKSSFFLKLRAWDLAGSASGLVGYQTRFLIIKLWFTELDSYMKSFWTRMACDSGNLSNGLSCVRSISFLFKKEQTRNHFPLEIIKREFNQEILYLIPSWFRLEENWIQTQQNQAEIQIHSNGA